MDVRSCQRKCEQTPGCSGVTWQGADHSGVGRCYRKAHVDLAQCDKGTALDTYIASAPFGGERDGLVTVV